MKDIPLVREMLYSQRGPLLIQARVATLKLERVWPEPDGIILVRTFTQRLRARAE